MKTKLSWLSLLILSSTVALAANAPGDIRMEQRNQSGNAWPYIIFPTSANSLIGTDANGKLSLVTIGSGLQLLNGVLDNTGGGGGGGGAPTNATYITQTPNGTLSAEQALSALSSGLMFVTNATGVITSIGNSAGLAAA